MKALTLLAVLALAAHVPAAIEWTWSNAGSGTEQGTFTTDGVYGAGAPAGTYTILDYAYTASDWGMPTGSVSDGTYIWQSPEIGFDWDGAAPTVFWRSSGALTNGFWLQLAIYTPGEPDYIGLGIDWFLVNEDDDIDHYQEDLTPVITPIGPATANEAKTFGGVKALFR